MSEAPRPGVAIATHSLLLHHEHELGWTEGRRAHLPTQYKQGKWTYPNYFIPHSAIDVGQHTVSG